MTRIENILEAAVAEMESLEIEDTTENRRSFLAGMRDEWLESSDRSFEMIMYLRAIDLEIRRLSVLTIA